MIAKDESKDRERIELVCVSHQMWFWVQFIVVVQIRPKLLGIQVDIDGKELLGTNAHHFLQKL